MDDEIWKLLRQLGTLKRELMGMTITGIKGISEAAAEVQGKYY